MPCSSPRALRAQAALVAAVAAALFAQTLAHPFVWDDAYNVVDNPAIRSLAEVPSFFGQAWGAGADDAMAQGINTNYWRPVALTSYALDHALFGLSPTGFHATNVLLHAIASVLVLLLGRRLFPREPLAALAATLVWAVHPLHTEAVDVITYRTDLLAAVFLLSGLVVWRGPRAPDGAPLRPPAAERVALLLIVPTLYALGLASKEMAVTLPGLCALLDLADARRFQQPPPASRGVRLVAVAVRVFPLALVLIGYLTIRATLLTPSAYSYFGDAPGSHVALTMIGVAGLYVRLLLFPWPLNPFYDWSVLPVETSPLSPPVLVGAAVLIGWAVLTARAWRRDAMLGAALAAFFVALTPVSQVLPVVVAAGERFLYAASAFPLLAVAVGVARVCRTHGARRAAAYALGALVLVFAALTVARNTDWRSDRAILEANVRDWPQSFNARVGLARLHEREGRPDEARALYEMLGLEQDLRRMDAGTPPPL